MTTTQTNDAARKIDRQFCTGLISTDEAIALLVSRCGKTEDAARAMILLGHKIGCGCTNCR